VGDDLESVHQEEQNDYSAKSQPLEI